MKRIKLSATQRFLIQQARKTGVATKIIKQQIKRYLSSNKALAKRKYYETPLGLANLKRQQKAIYNKSVSARWNTLSKKEKQALAIKSEKLGLKIKYYRFKQQKTKQTKIDAYEDYLHAKAQLKARVKEFRAGGREFSKTYYIKPSTESSYQKNQTVNVQKETWVVAHYYNELQKELDKGKSYDDVIEQLFKQAIKDGDLRALAQGESYGYIDETNYEVLSPI